MESEMNYFITMTTQTYQQYGLVYTLVWRDIWWRSNISLKPNTKAKQYFTNISLSTNPIHDPALVFIHMLLEMHPIVQLRVSSPLSDAPVV